MEANFIELKADNIESVFTVNVTFYIKSIGKQTKNDKTKNEVKANKVGKPTFILYTTAYFIHVSFSSVSIHKQESWDTPYKCLIFESRQTNTYLYSKTSIIRHFRYQRGD